MSALDSMIIENQAKFVAKCIKIIQDFYEQEIVIFIIIEYIECPFNSTQYGWYSISQSL